MELEAVVITPEIKASDFTLQLLELMSDKARSISLYTTFKKLIQTRDAALAADAAATATSAFILKKNGPPIQQAMEQTLSAVIEGVNARRQYVEHRSSEFYPEKLTRDAEALLALTESATS